MPLNCAKEFTITGTLGEPTDAMIFCPSTGDFYTVGITTSRISRYDGTTFALKGISPIGYEAPFGTPLFYEPNGGYIYTRLGTPPAIFPPVIYHKIDPLTMLGAGVSGTALWPGYAVGGAMYCRKPSNGNLLSVGGGILRIDPTTDVVLAWNNTTGFGERGLHSGRDMMSCCYYTGTDSVWNSTVHGINSEPGIWVADPTDLQAATYGPAWNPYWFFYDPLTPGGYPNDFLAILEVPVINKIVVAYCPVQFSLGQNTYAHGSMMWVDPNTYAYGVFVTDFGGLVTDAIYNPDDTFVYCHTANGHVVVWDPSTDSIVHTYTGFQVHYPTGPAGFFGGFSRMAFDATRTHLYVSSYGVTQVF